MRGSISYGVLNANNYNNRGSVMFLVINERTGAVARRCKDIMGAERLALALTEQGLWIDGDSFDVRVANG